MTEREAATAIYEYAAGLLAKGQDAATVEQHLVREGIPADIARVVLQNLESVRQSGGDGPGPLPARRDPTREMILGAVICGIGLVVTIGSYASAAVGGGRYVLAWGAIVFGGLRFFRGLFASGGAG